MPSTERGKRSEVKRENQCVFLVKDWLALLERDGVQSIGEAARKIREKCGIAIERAGMD